MKYTGFGIYITSLIFQESSCRELVKAWRYLQVESSPWEACNSCPSSIVQRINVWKFLNIHIHVVAYILISVYSLSVWESDWNTFHRHWQWRICICGSPCWKINCNVWTRLWGALYNQWLLDFKNYVPLMHKIVSVLGA